MTNVGDVLTVLGASAGIAVLLIMALVPLLVDRHRPQERLRRADPVRVPAQRGPSDLTLRARAGTASCRS